MEQTISFIADIYTEPKLTWRLSSQFHGNGWLFYLESGGIQNISRNRRIQLRDAIARNKQCPFTDYTSDRFVDVASFMTTYLSRNDAVYWVYISRYV